MPYIGKEPVAGNFVLLDSITTSATATYALTKDSVAYSPESARNMIVSLNGVTQAPEAAFTVSGSNITFSSALTASDVIDYILVLGDVLSVGTPSDGTVGTSQMSYPLGNFSSTGIDDNATSTAITIDSSENVGIGTTSPSDTLHVYQNSADNVVAKVENASSNHGSLLQFSQVTSGSVAAPVAYVGHGGDNTGDLVVNNASATNTKFYTNSTERMRIDSSGNVGIGTTSPTAYTGQTNLNINSGAVSRIDFDISDSLQGYVISESGYLGVIANTSNFLMLGAGSLERMRIDSSGNLLIGTTQHRPATNNVNGVSIDATYGIEASITSGGPLTLNRKSTNGGIISLKKDGTTCGFIGSRGDTTASFVGYPNSGNGAGISGSTNMMIPTNENGTAQDNRIQLGSASTRWTDLYLSGGAYIGGTGSANHLDDYEEGTWTPSFPNGGTLTVNTAVYTKVGRQVVASCYISNFSSIPNDNSGFRIGGLPFNSGIANSYAGGSIGYAATSNINNWADPLVIPNGNYIYFHYLDGSTGNDVRNANVFNTVSVLILQVIYFTA